MSIEARHIVCPHCDSTNRIPSDKPARAAVEVARLPKDVLVEIDAIACLE